MFRLLISVINGKEDVRNFRIMINSKLNGREKKIIIYNHHMLNAYLTQIQGCLLSLTCYYAVLTSLRS